MSTFDTSFTPDSNGFAWPNTFNGEDIVTSWFDQELITPESASDMLGLIYGGPPGQLTADMLDISTGEIVGELGGLVDAGGLSGGMCLVALERYRRDLGPWKRKSGKTSNNFARLASHQFEIFGRWNRLVEMVSDMNRPDVAHAWNPVRSLGDLSTIEWWPRIRRRLSDGSPMPLVLYRSRWNPFANHVVVATGSRESANRDEVRLYLYDPNHPGVVTHLEVDFGRKNSFRLGPRRIYGSGLRRVRGFKRIRRETAGTDPTSPEMLAHLAAM